MKRPLGLCPACESPGPIGKPCDMPVCERRGYHFIPSAFVEVDHGLIDPMLGQQFGEYLVVHKLGMGGAGGVYLALQRPIWMKAALKVLETGEEGPNEAILQRFRGEAAALARLNHPNIVRLLKFGSEKGRPYLVMEYVEENRTLRSVMREGLTFGEVERILQQLVNALEAAHASGVIHRDIKPANIMLQSVPGEPHFVRLVDFGLAKFVDEGDTTRFLAGTPAYMAPEQIAKEGIGPWSDWYALGAIAFEMITGQRAYPSGTSEQVIAMKQDPNYDPCLDLEATGLPTSTVGLLRGMLDHVPARRLCDAHQIREALTHAFAELDPEFMPYQGELEIRESSTTSGLSEISLQMPTRWQRFISERRNRYLLGGGLAVGAMLSGITAAVIFKPAPTPAPAPAPAPVSRPLQPAPPTPNAPAFSAAETLPLAAPLPPPDAAPAREINLGPTPYQRALSAAEEGDAEAAAEALEEALTESEEPEALLKQAQEEEAFEDLRGDKLDAVLKREKKPKKTKTRRRRKKKPPVLKMERL